MSKEKIDPKVVAEYKAASWSFNLSSVMPFLIIIPLLLFFIGKIFGSQEVEKVGGFIAAGVLGIFIVAFFTNLVCWHKRLGSSEAKTKRAQAVIREILADDSLLLEIETRDRTVLKIRSNQNSLVNFDSREAIDEKDLELALITAKGFPRIRKIP